jgi:polysaccharide biosynthesis/export protein
MLQPTRLQLARRSLRALFLLLVLLPGLHLACRAQAKPLDLHPRYLLSPGDIIDLNYRFTPAFNQTVTIPPDGYVMLNIVGSVKVGGLTVDEAHDLIVKRASDRLNAPDLILTLKEFQQPSVVVSGEVQKPGKVLIRDGSTAMAAIMMAGGFGENARAGQVLLFRKINSDTAEVRILKLSHVKNRLDLENDTALQPGDMILVQRDRIWKFSRYIKLTNVGFYFNPLDRVP